MHGPKKTIVEDVEYLIERLKREPPNGPGSVCTIEHELIMELAKRMSARGVSMSTICADISRCASLNKPSSPSTS